MKYRKTFLILEQYIYSFYTLILISVSSYLFELTDIGQLTLIVTLYGSWYSIFEQSFFYQYLKNIPNIGKTEECGLLNAQILIFIITGACLLITVLFFISPDEGELIKTHLLVYFVTSILYEHIRKIQIALEYNLHVFIRSISRIVPLAILIITSWIGFDPTLEMLILALSIWNIGVSVIYLPKPIRNINCNFEQIIFNTKKNISDCKFLSVSVIIDSIINITINIFLSRVNGLAWLALFRIYQSIFGIINPIIQYVFLEYFKTQHDKSLRNTHKLFYVSGAIFLGLFVIFDYLLIYVFSNQAKFDFYYFSVFTCTYLMLIIVNHNQYLVIKFTNGRLMLVSSAINLITVSTTLFANSIVSFNESDHWILLWASLSFVKILVLSSGVRSNAQ
jgi:hypothetical protein